MPWYVAISSVESSIALVGICQENGGSAYCPMIRKAKRISRSHKIIEAAHPAYPGYFFVAFGSERKFGDRDKQRFRFMTYGRSETLVWVSDEIINRIQIEEQGWNEHLENQRSKIVISAGQSVRIRSGLFKGSIGEVVWSRKGFAEISTGGVFLKISCLLLENSGA